ncbi:hypothetical protein PENANT_c101G08340 [Penicillium antarcticum]|uniref:MARVEL domain-containing protein n=1 Tax=Penicillium antarcticum TaxID=416450 RepID=A0A1V6PM50_9EURO|nr:hypothetical protein PENANT_c101G08340 [Penicillium antarcticum]
MPLNTAGAVIRMRLAILFLATTWLAVASLSSATARFATVLRDRAMSDIINANDAVLDITFRTLMGNVQDCMVIVALISALFSIFGIALVIHPRWLQQDCKFQLYYGCIQLAVSLAVLSLGGYVASHVHGFRTCFEFFDSEDRFPYYKIMYYGAVGQAAFGSLVVIMSLACFVVRELCGY